MNDASNENTQKIVEAWPTGKGHISFSELSNWLECSYRYKLLYIDKLQGEYVPTPHVILGTGVHAANEEYVRTRQLKPDIAVDIITKGWNENLDLFTKGPFPSWASSGFGDLDPWLDRARKLVADVPAFLDTMFPGWVCHAAEEQLYESIANQPVNFKGFIDAVLKVPDKRGKDRYWIIDWKTCGWGWARDKQQDPNVQLQLVLYKAFWAQKHGVDPKDVRCAFALLKRDGKAGSSISLVPVSVGPTTLSRGLKVIDNHTRSVRRGMFLKNRESCRFCEFDNTEHCKRDV